MNLESTLQTNSHSLGKDKLATVLSYYRESLIDGQNMSIKCFYSNGVW